MLGPGQLLTIDEPKSKIMISSTASTGNKLYIAIWIVNNTDEIELDLSLSFHRITGLLINSSQYPTTGALACNASCQFLLHIRTVERHQRQANSGAEPGFEHRGASQQVKQQSYVIKCIYDNNIDNIQIKVYFTIYIKEKISEYYKEKQNKT